MKLTLTAILDAFFIQQSPGASFYSEAAVQHKIGIELFKRRSVEPVLERKIPNTSEYLDIYAESMGIRYGIELKYKTRKCQHPLFEYTKQGAQNNCRYDFIWDIARLERFKAAGIIDKGYAVFMTNDPYYLSSCRPGTAVAPFQLPHGRVLSGTFIPRWVGRTTPIALTGTYSVSWSPLPTPVTGMEPFRYCLIEV